MDAETSPTSRVVASVPAYGARYAAIVAKTGMSRPEVDAGLKTALERRMLIQMPDGRFIHPLRPVDPEPDKKPAKTPAKRAPRRQYAPREPDARGWWKCTFCGAHKPVNQFRLTWACRPRSWCRPCERADSKQRMQTTRRAK